MVLNIIDEDSDVNLLVELDSLQNLGLRYFGWFTELEILLNKKVTVTSAGWENKYLKPFIDQNKSIIYERHADKVNKPEEVF